MPARPIPRRPILLPRLSSGTPTSLVLRRAFTNRQPATQLQSRPSLPFLGTPVVRHQFRYLSTERRKWIVNSVRLAARWTIYFWGSMAALYGIQFAITQENFEREHPTPREWSFMARMLMRSEFSQLYAQDGKRKIYPLLMKNITNLVDRLESPNHDGKGVVELPKDPEDETALPVFDISAKSENWRRGYHEAMLAMMKCAEQCDGFVVDVSRGIVFPPELMIGPSNPRPSPIPPGSYSAPLEENCRVLYPRPDAFYKKLLLTKGWTTKQEVENALMYANWLEYKGDNEGAERQYAAAMAVAARQAGADVPPADADIKKSLRSWLTKDTAVPSENLINVRTALATFYARTGELDTAVPMLVSLLRTRRGLLSSTTIVANTTARAPPVDYSNEELSAKLFRLVKSILVESPYPAPPLDGSRPPVRDAKELCEEAALQLHLGEVMYASSKGSNASREEGLAWTREAIDVAEEQLHRIGKPTAARRDPTAPARATCRQCLTAGLDNWAEMVERLAREEEERKKKAEQEGDGKSAGWFGLWGEGKAEDLGRWSAEDKVVKERTQRAKALLEELKPPGQGIMSIFQA